MYPQTFASKFCSEHYLTCSAFHVWMRCSASSVDLDVLVVLSWGAVLCCMGISSWGGSVLSLALRGRTTCPVIFPEDEVWVPWSSSGLLKDVVSSSVALPADGGVGLACSRIGNLFPSHLIEPFLSHRSVAGDTGCPQCHRHHSEKSLTTFCLVKWHAGASTDTGTATHPSCAPGQDPLPCTGGGTSGAVCPDARTCNPVSDP